ncbi:hypothetical protein L2K70_13150 [Nocardioides KLBMP 9356]|uniref:Calcium-binding protein n=1 Tax=Nocardioides potassii TaxID=2911371 RepID=A0ABS9HE13_9ACTN|nr:hypothetical protein [Nocardioides potassii]MCF6378552.1 hypothetical protein [Nocardioides potassii]
MRSLHLATTGLLAATLLATPTAYAAGETCQGRPATVVGTPNQLGLTGTEGDDVIVTNGATSTSTLGGNDLVCVTGGSQFGDVRLDAGSGDDVVDATAVVGGVSVQLGAGADTYTGSAYDERVAGGAQGADTERDVITTGAGGDDVVVSGTRRDLSNADVVMIGADDGQGFGNEVYWSGPLAPGGRLDGGGDALLGFDTVPGSVVVDAVAGILSHDGVVVLSWTGVDRFRAGSDRTTAPGRFEFRGSDRDESLELVFAQAYQGRQRLDLGGGDDTLLLGDENLGARGSRYLGGAGDDHVALSAGTRLDLDLERERIKTWPAGSVFRSTFAGFESQLVSAKRLVLKGTNRSEDLRFYACRATVKGRGGADDIRQSRGNDYFEAGLCDSRSFRLYGGGGNDVLRGGRGPDLVVGGSGRDTAYGNAGRDRCSAEKARSCEVRLR